MKAKFITLFIFLSLIFQNLIAQDYESNEKMGNWQVNKKTDPLTDEAYISIILQCNESLETSSSRGKAIGLRLAEGIVSFVIMWDNYLGDNNNIVLRFDGGEVEEHRWSMASNSRALFFPSRRIGQNIKEFVVRLIETEELVIGATPRRKRVQTAVFDVRGLGYAILPELEHFGWEDLEQKIRKHQKTNE